MLGVRRIGGIVCFLGAHVIPAGGRDRGWFQLLAVQSEEGLVESSRSPGIAERRHDVVRNLAFSRTLARLGFVDVELLLLVFEEKQPARSPAVLVGVEKVAVVEHLALHLLEFLD